MISDLYKSDMPRRIKRNIQGRTRASNITPVTEVGGYIDYGNTYTDISIITMTLTSPLATNTATKSTNRST